MAETITPTPEEKFDSILADYVKLLTDQTIAYREEKNWNGMSFEDFIKNQEERFKAMRSIRGLDYKDLPKDSPWPGCSDIGIPIDAITIQSIVARTDRVEFERLPLTHITPVGQSDVASAPKVEAYLDWQKMNKMRIRIPKMMATRKSLTCGSFFRKFIFEEYFVYDDEDILALRDPDTKQLLKDENNELIGIGLDEPIPLNESGHPYQAVWMKSAKKKMYYRGPAIYGRSPTQILWPKDETNYDPQEWDWWCDLYDRSMEWLETTGKQIGFKNIDKLISIANARITRDNPDAKLDKKKLVKIREWYGTYEVNGKERELVVVIAPEYNILLGWDFDKFKQKTGMNRLVHRCPIPMEGQVIGMSVPTFIKGLRDALDASWNQMIDRGQRFNNPPVIYGYGSGFDPNKHNWGYRFWPEKVPGSLRVLATPHTEQIEFAKIELLIGLIQRLFGVTDTTSGVENPNNQTYGGITTLLAEGNVNIDMLIQTLNESNIQEDQIIIAMNAVYMQTDEDGNPIPEEFPIIDSYSQVMEDPDNPFATMTQEELLGKYNYMSSGASLTTNTRSIREEAGFLYRTAIESVGRNPFIDLNVLREATSDLYKSFGKKNIKVASVEEIQAQMAQQAQAQMQMAQAQGLKKAVEGVRV